MSTWIKRTDREPTTADLPYFAGYYTVGGNWLEFLVDESCSIGNGTHWRSVKCDPPPRELTQREKDKKMVEGVFHKNMHVDTLQDMLAAIYAERREIARLMFFRAPYWRGQGYKWVEDLRARLDEQGAYERAFPGEPPRTM